MSILLECSRPIAEDSLDHLYPLGTLQDSSTNPRFNAKLYSLFQIRPLKILGIGCAGGGFVEECLRDGRIGVGLEGSSEVRRLFPFLTRIPS